MAPEMRRLFGGETRAKVLGLLAGSREPRTGYEVSKALGINPSKVYGVLRGLEGAGILAAIPDPSGYTRYLVADADLRRFLLKRVRISLEDDWLAPSAVADRESLREAARRLRVDVRAPGGRSMPAVNASEFERPPEKDRALRRIAAARARRPSRKEEG